MATSGVMADFGRLPPQRKAMVFAVIGLVLGALYWQFAWKPLNRNLETAQSDNEMKAGQNNGLAGDIPKYEALKNRMKELTALINENQKALPTEAEVPAFFETLERKVTESGVEILKWRKIKEEPVETFVRVPVEIEISGTFMQIKRFFASLVQKSITPGGGEERDRIVAIDNLTLGNPVVRNREIHLVAKFVAVTFRQEDAAPVAPPKKGAPAKPAAVPKAAPMPTAPPMPSANTPAGAKASVEDSMDKSDAALKKGTAPDEGSARLKGGI
ncbi:MAG: hypothetical protein JWP01_2069 [Myxococcales bacterium]|nr:hypothetical protein [Myxococcales bacterium]